MQDAVALLLEQNYTSEFFVSAAEADREAETNRAELLGGKLLRLPSSESHDSPPPSEPPTSDDEDDTPFR